MTAAIVRALALDDRLALDQRRDRQDVVRREVLRPRIRMFTVFQFVQNAFTCCATSCFDVVFARKSYVAGKRNPSTFARLCGAKHGIDSVFVART